MKPKDVDIPSLLRFEPESGHVFLRGRRILLLDAAAIGAMREQLIETVGPSVARGILSRWGYQNGYRDAQTLDATFSWDSEVDLVSAGPIVHMWEGVAAIEVRELLADRATGSFLMRGAWRNSYEAEEHVKSFGRSTEPVCWTITGYASGYTSAVMGRPMVAVEETCVARGDAECRFVIRPLEEWGEEHRAYVQSLERENPIKLLEQRIEEKRLELALKNSELEETARDLASSNEKLRELDTLKTEFVANISHEFRTPLTLNLAPLEEMLGEERSPRDRRRLETIHRNSLRLLRLVNNLLDFAQLEAGRIHALYRRIDLCAATREIASAFESAFAGRGLEFVVDLDPAGAYAFVDVEMWEKIVSNLLSNALKYTSEGRVSLAVRNGEREVVLEVRDTGPGIPAEDLHRIFIRFYRGERFVGRGPAGTGIGLALVAELCKLHSGSIDVESRPGEGSVFRVTLPTGRDHLPADRVVEEGPFEGLISRRTLDAVVASLDTREDGLGGEVPCAEPQAPRDRVLIVEDNPDMRDYLRGLLLPRFEIDIASDGVEGLERARQTFPALVITDVMMPRMDGFTLCERLKFDPATASIPVIILTARAEIGDKLHGLEIGADDYVLKPFHPRELLARVTTQVSLHRTRRQLQTYATELERLVAEQVGEIREQNRNLAEAQREMEDFLFIASHDLQSPLVAIAGYAHLLESRIGKSVGPVEQRAMERISAAVKSMQGLIDSLLTMARARRREPQRVPLDLRKTVREVLDELAPRLEASGAEVVVGALPRTLVADPLQTSQILRNLVENAVKYREESRPLRIEIGCEEDDGAVTLFVRDNGVGIAPEYHHVVFRPLSRLEEVKGAAGSGMGLYIVRKIAEANGGRAWVESEPGKGSTFFVRIPRDGHPAD